MSVILVAENIFAKGQSTFEALNQESSYSFVPVKQDEHTVSDAIRKHQSKAFIAGTHPYTSSLYQALPHGGIISRFGVGHDSIDKELASQRGLYVTNTPGVLDNAVAEHACWMMGNLARHIHLAHHNTVAGSWNAATGIELQGRKATILGFGRIGQSLCRKLSFGFDMHVTGVGTRPASEYAHLQETTGYRHYTTDRDAAISDADFVILLMASTPATRHLADASFFEKMPNHACLINSARGAVVNELDLYEALHSGHIAAAGLDVFEDEPYRAQDPNKDLRTLPNILLTPHIGANTSESNSAMAAAAAQNVFTILEQGAPACRNIVNPK
ncbi:NAD(P)-dependent oxidoreductase [Rubritalea marina]|uniref:NAD(P)-dependent oxidoreductase n=1 Tax=Rubritalea marina TaxID=361055 RepID=UPI000376E150|nr:NAD(P)-dependent oxidoreductase [Rubritalea marina]